ncbi:MAG TPA: branched-chain amino acid ABC transporter permease [Thermoplasmata archaeon]|nr:branched-chain amino acid ABC transporter permease [Thermoplasmata archaeon]
MLPEGGPRARRAASPLLRTARRTVLSPTYLFAIALIGFVFYAASGSPDSFFAYSMVLASIFITLALAWDFSSGLTGYLNFGLPFFFGLGAFGAGYLSWHGDRVVPELLVFGFAVGLFAGFLFSIPTLRLRGPYFSLLSLLLPIIGTDFVVAFWAQLHLPTEGYYSLPFLYTFWTPVVQSLSPLHLPIQYLATTNAGELLLLSIVNGVLLTGFLLLRGSHFGLVLRGIRDDEDALGSQGIWTFPYKVTAFTLSSGVAAYAGAAYATTVTYSGVDTFQFTFILFPVLIVILGGLGRLSGSVLAGYLVIYLYQYLQPVFSTATLIIFSSIAILLVLFVAGGLERPLRAFIQFMRTPEAG